MEASCLRIKVEADLFSGRVNPTWYVAEEFVYKLIASFCETCSRRIELPSLGYRGILVHLPEAEGGIIRCFSGFAANELNAWCDEERAVEIALLGSGANVIDPKLLRELL